MSLHRADELRIISEQRRLELRHDVASKYSKLIDDTLKVLDTSMKDVAMVGRHSASVDLQVIIKNAGYDVDDEGVYEAIRENLRARGFAVVGHQGSVIGVSWRDTVKKD